MIGLACGDKNYQDLNLQALDVAIAMHGASEGLIHHSDRGSTYNGRQLSREPCEARHRLQHES